MTDLLTPDGVGSYPLGGDLERGAASSVSKAFRVLETLVDVRGEAVGVSDLAHVAELPKSTVHRLLNEMEAHGFVGREGMKYRLGPLLTEMPARTSRSDYDELRNCALPELERLFDRTSATVHLAVLAGAVVLYLEKITAVGGGHMPSRVGGTAPPTCTALGKAVLAFSDDRILQNIPARLPRMTRYSIASPGVLARELFEIRKTGVAHDREESVLGINSVAAPILVRSRPVGAVSVSVGGGDSADRYAEHVREAAQLVSKFVPMSMGSLPFSR